MIYFIRYQPGGPIKIGTTPNWARRAAEHATANGGDPPILLGVMDGGQPEERRLHLRFAHLRTDSSTPVWEWFHPADELVDFIRAEGRPWRESDDTPTQMQSNSVSIRGSREWREWLRELAQWHRTTPTGLIDLALDEWAKRSNFRPPPRRV